MRFEVTYRDQVTADGMASTLREFGFVRANVTDTSPSVDSMGFAASLRTAASGLDVMLNVSAKHHADADAFLRHVRRGYDLGLRKFLLVSGHPRRGFDALAAIKAFDGIPSDAVAYCVYNPFFGGARQAEEDDRLHRKLASERVRGVCLQIGFDEKAIRAAASRIRTLRRDVELFGSVPVPSPALLGRLATKALHGVRLPTRYFLSKDAAHKATLDVLRLYHELGIMPLAFAFGAGRDAIAGAAALRDATKEKPAG